MRRPASSSGSWSRPSSAPARSATGNFSACAPRPPSSATSGYRRHQPLRDRLHQHRRARQRQHRACRMRPNTWPRRTRTASSQPGAARTARRGHRLGLRHAQGTRRVPAQHRLELSARGERQGLCRHLERRGLVPQQHPRARTPPALSAWMPRPASMSPRFPPTRKSASTSCTATGPRPATPR